LAVRRILKLGDPMLRQVAAHVADPGAADIRALIADMRDTLDAVRGNGIAAPQIGIGLRVFLYAIPRDRLPECESYRPEPWRALINPVITPLTSERRPIGVERCLSIPGLHGPVPRHPAIRVTALAPNGEALDYVACGYHARLVQHEYDHLDGILFPMRMSEVGALAFDDQAPPGAFRIGQEDCPDPVGGPATG
jgi:peptide deformylase